MSFLSDETDASLFHRIASLPKIDLHRHVTGSISAATAVRIAAKYGVELPTYIAADLDKILFSQESVSDHQQYFIPWPILNKLFVSLAAVREILIEIVRDAAADNVIYTELRVGPRAFLGDRSEYSFKEFAETVTVTLREADSKFGTTTKCILGIPRHVYSKLAPATRSKMFAKMLYIIREHASCFVGVDLNGDELAADASEFTSFFNMANDLDVPVTIHAGEVGPAENVSYAIRHLHASRIGHGIAAVESEPTLNLLAERQCVLEICPTSNKFLGIVNGYRELPLERLRERNIPFVICTDNPVRCRTSLTEELYKVAKSFSYSIDDVKQLCRASARAAFADDNTRNILIANLA
ncbi:adenosine deaminase [Bradyrhizobium sp. YR681]|uniref:adenosine deaminase n=1 Tax=Bradyrhizobium sp. YR681 TaxID=1144344 RepID=UPI0012F63686|nr:adenosine deaminase [Bradyrhizobium sp. YR681]